MGNSISICDLLIKANENMHINVAIMYDDVVETKW